MVKRILLGGVLGGVVMFIWGAISHMATPLGHAGVSSLPAAEAIVPALRGNLTEPGFYFFPPVDMSSDLTKEQRAAADAEFERQYLAGPSGILIYEPKGRAPMEAKLLVTELLSNIACALLAGLLLAPAAPSLGYLGRVSFVAGLGLFAALAIEVSYWNWYHFPTAYMLAQLVDQTIGAAAAGLVLAAFVKRPA